MVRLCSLGWPGWRADAELNLAAPRPSPRSVGSSHGSLPPATPLQYAHKACVQRWLNERPEKGSVQCEVCGKPLKGNWQLWRASDDPLQPHLAALWHYASLLLHGSTAPDTRSASEEWAAPGISSTERRRVSGSTAWGLALLLAASAVLFLRQVLRVVPSTGETVQAHDAVGCCGVDCSCLVSVGRRHASVLADSHSPQCMACAGERPEHGEVVSRGAGAAIEGIALLLLLVWLAFRLLGVGEWQAARSVLPRAGCELDWRRDAACQAASPSVCVSWSLPDCSLAALLPLTPRAGLPPFGMVHAARRSVLSSWRASRQQAVLVGGIGGSPERAAGGGGTLLAVLPAAPPPAAVDLEAAAAAAAAAGAAGAGLRPSL